LGASWWWIDNCELMDVVTIRNGAVWNRWVEMDCHFESICESCTFFVTTIEFRSTLQAQRDDAERKGQVGRQKIFDGLLDRLTTEAS
jgi:hypothetical protein